jgi:hypothetical protein
MICAGAQPGFHLLESPFGPGSSHQVTPAEAAAALAALAAGGGGGGGGAKPLRAAAARLGAAVFRGLGAAAPADVAACVAAWGRLGFVAGPQGLLAECLQALLAAVAAGGAGGPGQIQIQAQIISPEDLGAVVAGLGELAEAAGEADGGRLPAPPHLVHGTVAACCSALTERLCEAQARGGEEGAGAKARAAVAALEGAARLRHRLAGGCLAPLAAAVSAGCAAQREPGVAAALALRGLRALAALRTVAPRAFCAAALPRPLLAGLATTFVAALQQGQPPPAGLQEGPTFGVHDCIGGSSGSQAWGVGEEGTWRAGEARAAAGAFAAALRQLAVGGEPLSPATAEAFILDGAAALAAPPPAAAAP